MFFTDGRRLSENKAILLLIRYICVMKRAFFCVIICFISSLTVAAQKTLEEEPLSGSTVKRNMVVSKELVPPDFNPDKHILLVLHLPNRNHPEKTSKNATGSLRKILDKYYLPYRYLIVTPSELKNNEYADTSVYRYVLGNSVTSYGRVDGGYTKNMNTGVRTPNQPIQVAHTVVAFRFHDRSQEIYYRYSASNSFIGDSLRPLFEAIKAQQKGALNE